MLCLLITVVPLTVYGGRDNLMCSYLIDRTLFVVTHGDTSKRPFTAGVPRGGIWSPILFNMYMHHLSAQILRSDLFTYVDGTTLVLMVQLSLK